MGATYTRQSTFTEGDVIQASDSNDEFDQLLAAFAASTGHTHDGTTGEGGPVTALLGTSITIGTGGTGADVTVTFDGESNDGVLKWMEDEDYFEFSDDILIASTEKIQFRDTAIFINSSADGQLDIDADTELEITAPTVDINASTAVLISNDLKLDSDAAVLGFGADNDVTLTHVADTGLLLNSTMAIQFNDASQFINAPSATVLDINATDEIELNATLIDINGNVDVSGTLTVAGAVDFGDAALSNVGAVQLDSIAGDADSNTSIAFSGSDVITVTAGGETQITFNNGSILPTTDDDVDLGSSALQFKDLYIDGTANIDTGSIDTANVGALTVSGSTTLGATSFGDADITNVGSIALDTITNDGTNITLDSGGDIILDAAGNEVFFKASGTTILTFKNDSSDAVFTVDTADKNFTIKGTDDSSAITALDIDMALAGKATFNGDVVVGGDLTISGDDLVMGTNTAGHILVADGTNFNPIAVTDLSEISTVADGDVFLAVDASGGGLKKITRSTVIAGTGVSGNISNIVEDTTPQLGGNLDTNSHNILIDDAHFIGDENGNEQIVFQTTSSAVNQIEVTNAATGNGVQIASTGGDTNIDLKLLPKGSGQVVIDGNVGIESGLIDLKNAGAVSKIKFYCESSNAHAQTLQGAPHSEAASNSLTLPSTGGDVDLVSTASTATLTNKTLTSPKINEDVAVTATATEINVLDGITAVVGELNALDIGSTAVGTAVASKAVILDSNKDYTGIRNFTISGNLSVAGTTTTVNTVTMEAANAIVFEGATADAHETTLTIVDPTADRTINLPNQSGTLPVLAAASNTAITSTPEELNILDGATVVVGEINALDLGSTAVGNAIASKAVILDSNKDFTGLRNVTATGAVTGGSAVFDGGVAIDNITIDGTEIDLSSGDLTVDVAGDIILDAGGGDLKFAVAGTEILSVTNSSSDVIIKPIVDTKDIIFQQRDGTEVARIEDNGTFNVVTSKLAINGTAVTSTAAELNILDGVTSTAAELNILDGVTSTAAELNILDGVTATASELNLLDGGTSVGSSITVADADGFVVNDGGTMKTIPATDVKTYAAGSAATKGFAIAMAIVFG